MNKMKHFLLVFACLLAASTAVTSCISNDNNNGNNDIYTLKDLDKAYVVATAAGSYSGYLYYYNNTAANFVDSVATQWTIDAGNTLVLNLPLKVLANYISLDADKQSVTNTTTVQNLATTIIVPDEMYTTLYNESYFTMFMSVTNNQSLYTLSDNKALTIDLETSMYYNNDLIYNMLRYYKSETLGYILVKDVKVGSNIYNVELPIWFDGTKAK